MKKFIPFVFMSLFALGCLSKEVNTEKTKQGSSSLYPGVPSFDFEPLNRLGCSNDLLEEEPLFEYLSAIESTPIDIASSQEALANLNRQLNCMSAYDFAINYSSAMDYLSSNYDMSSGQKNLVPMLIIFIEHGAAKIDLRAKKWVFSSSYKIHRNIELELQPFDGIGLYFSRGLNIAKLNSAEVSSLTMSFTSATWMRSNCRIKNAVILNKNIPNMMSYVCLNDPCPITDEVLTAEFSLDSSYCQDANDAFDQAKEVASGFGNGSYGEGSSGNSSGGQGPNGGFTTDDSVFDEILDCVNDFNSGNSPDYACAVQVANRNNPHNNTVNNFNPGESIQVGIDIKLRPDNCAPNSLYSPDEGEDPMKKLDRGDVARKRVRYEYAESDYQGALEAFQLFVDAEDQEERDFWKEIWASRVGGDSSDNVNELEAKTATLENLRNAAKAAYESAKQKFKDRWGSDPEEICQNDGSGCSNSCDINEQISQDTSECLGLTTNDISMDPVTPVPTGNPEVMYPTPENVEGNGDFDVLGQCIASVLGVNSSSNPLDENDSCGQLIMCTNNATALVNSDLNCSCGEAGADAFGFSYGWGDLYECGQAILCTDTQNYCGCGVLDGPGEVDDLGGIPTNPEVFFRVPSYDENELPM